MGFVATVGDVFIFLFRILITAFKRPHRIKLFLKEFEFSGTQSLPIILVTSSFTGMVFSLHSSYAFGLFKAETLVGPSVALSLIRELGGVLTALMVAGRVGSAYSAQIGSMKVTEQIDALHSMAVNPIHYLAVPKALALFLATPMLYIIFIGLGLLGGFFVAVTAGDIPSGLFWRDIPRFVKIKDLWVGILKSSVFGVIIATISCYFGFKVEGGAEEVGKASTKSIVTNSILIFLTNFIISSMFFAR